MERLKIALLAGGDSSEREIALNSAAQISAALDAEKYDVTLIDVHQGEWKHTGADGETYRVDLNDFSMIKGDEKIKFEYALIIIHGTPGEDGKLQGYLEMMGVPFSSCSMTSSVVTFDKVSTKRAVAHAGINLAREVLLSRGEAYEAAKIVDELGLPLFVKPNASGSSFGVTKVKSVEELTPALTLAFSESEDALIEEAIVGREVSCGVMIAGGKEYIFPITELVSKNEYFDYEAKYTAGMCDEITPAPISEEIKLKLNTMTLAAYKACRCRGVVRIDFIITPEGEPYMIEINSIPGMSSGSIIPKQVREMGMSIGELYDIIIKDTL